MPRLRRRKITKSKSTNKILKQMENIRQIKKGLHRLSRRRKPRVRFTQEPQHPIPRVETFRRDQLPVYPRDAPSSNTIELAELRKEISDLKNDDKKLEELKHNNDIDKVRKDEVITQIKDQLKESRMSLKDIRDTVNYLLREKRLSPEEVDFVSEAVDKFKTPIKIRPIVGMTTPMITSEGEEIDLSMPYQPDFGSDFSSSSSSSSGPLLVDPFMKEATKEIEERLEKGNVDDGLLEKATKVASSLREDDDDDDNDGDDDDDDDDDSVIEKKISPPSPVPVAKKSKYPKSNISKNSTLIDEITENDVLQEEQKDKLIENIKSNLEVAPAKMEMTFYKLQELPLVLTLFSDKEEDDVVKKFRNKKTDNYVKKKLNKIKSLPKRGAINTLMYWKDYINDLREAISEKQAQEKKAEALKGKAKSKKKR